MKIEKVNHVNLNFWLTYCYLMLGLILFCLHSFEYEELSEQFLIYTSGILIFLPFEIVCSQVMFYIWKSKTFKLTYLFSSRYVSMNKIT